MIAYIAKNQQTARQLMARHFPHARVDSHGRVFSHQGVVAADGFLCTNADQLRGMELSGVICLESVHSELLQYVPGRLFRDTVSNHAARTRREFDEIQGALEPPKVEGKSL